MRRTNVCSDLTISNIRLAVRQTVADFCANPERTVENILSAQLENFAEPIQRLVAARIKHIYEELQCSILSPSNEAPSSVLRFLSEYTDEPEKDIIQRFEKGSSSSRHIRGQWQKLRTPSQIPVANRTALAVSVPHLKNLTNGSSSMNSGSDKRRKSAKNIDDSDFSSTESTSTKVSKSGSSSFSNESSLPQPIQESESSRQEQFLSERKSSAASFCNNIEQAPQYIRSNGNANMNDKILVEIKKVADDAVPVVLEEEFVPSFPLVEATLHPKSANGKSKKAASLCSSLRSDDDKVTVQYVPTKVLTTDAAVSTDSIFIDYQQVEMVEVGVNTVVEMGSNMADGSSSSNTTSDSAGQLPKRLFDTVFQRPSLRIVSLRPDGSIVPTDNSASPRFPSVREWTPVFVEGDVGEAVPTPEAKVYSVTSESDLCHPEDNGVEKLDSVSASGSRPDPFEEDLNTLANISPLPHS